MVAAAMALAMAAVPVVVSVGRWCGSDGGGVDAGADETTVEERR